MSANTESIFEQRKLLHKLSVVQCAYRLNEEGIMPLEKIQNEFPEVPGTGLEEKTFFAGKVLYENPTLLERLYPYCWEQLKDYYTEDEVSNVDLKAQLERNA